MNEFTPHFAPFVVLLFLGSAFLFGVSLLLLAYAAIRRSRPLGVIGAGLAALVAGGYAFLLFGASLISQEKIVPRGGWKYFCEIDCHIAFSIADVRTSAVLGPESQQTQARGQFVVVSLKTWFDEHTISPHRGNSPLQTGDRFVVLKDDLGRIYAPSTVAQSVLSPTEGAFASLDRPLRPGESFTTTLVFDVPQDARSLRLLVADPKDDWLGRMVIGHETSFLHKKIYLGLQPSVHS
jgi:Domain of unknown function (DUF4352)